MTTMRKLLGKSTKIEDFLFIVALLLVSILILHAFIPHHHPEEIFGHDQVQAALHGEDKKWWAVLALSTLLFALGTGLAAKSADALLSSSQGLFKPHFSALDISKLFDPVRIALREGRLQRKTYD